MSLIDLGQEAPPATGKKQEVSKEQQDETLLDLAFAMDCTGSMGSYIHQAQQNVATIVEEIVKAEKSDVRLALVEYRDHPPQDSTFVTRVLDFTSSVSQMKQRLHAASAQGGGDGPEAVADALHQLLGLSWRPTATKIVVFIADAPPHGLGGSGDGFPNGCPSGHDPMRTTNELAEKGVTIYMVGCEPSIVPYKDFFMALCHMTGGQYAPLGKASLLSKVIIAGAREEISLQRLMDEVNEEVVSNYQQQQAAGMAVDTDLIAREVHSKIAKKQVQVMQMQMNCASLPQASATAQGYASMGNMANVRRNFKKAAPAPASFGGFGGFGMSPMAAPPPAAAMDCMAPPPPPPAMGGMAPPPPPGGAVRSMAGGYPPPSMSRAAPAPMMAQASMMAPHPSLNTASDSAVEDSYACVQQPLMYEQTSRLVNRAMKMNKLK